MDHELQKPRFESPYFWGSASILNNPRYSQSAHLGGAHVRRFETAVFLFLIWPRNAVAARCGGGRREGDQVHRQQRRSLSVARSWRNLGNVSLAKRTRRSLSSLSLHGSTFKERRPISQPLLLFSFSLRRPLTSSNCQEHMVA